MTRKRLWRDGARPVRPVYGVGPFHNGEDKFSAFVLSRCRTVALPYCRAAVLSRYNFYLHTSRLDTQATAILENCARGLVPIIGRALAMPEAGYRARSEGVRQQVLTHHGWRLIFERITNIIHRDQRGEAVAGDADSPPS